MQRTTAKFCRFTYRHIIQNIILFKRFGILFLTVLLDDCQNERQLTTARANQKTGLTNDRAANWAPEVEFSPFRALSRRQMTFQFCY